MTPEIIFEDKHIVIINKPAGMPSQKDLSRDMDALSYVQKYCGISSECALISRLDRPVGGLMMISKHKEATKQLTRMQQAHQIQKTYLALVEGAISEGHYELSDFMMKTHQGVAEVWSDPTGKAPTDKRYKHALLTYTPALQVMVDGRDYTFVYVTLKTGRFHQIRAQLASHQMAIYGDTKYNPHFKATKGWHQIGLSAVKLSFLHPYTKVPVSCEIEPKDFPISIDKHK